MSMEEAIFIVVEYEQNKLPPDCTGTQLSQALDMVLSHCIACGDRVLRGG